MIDFAAARAFMHCEARLPERRLFSAAFEDGSTRALVAAVAAYANEDGGLGHALDPDVRAPTSQPVAVAFGLRALASVGEAPEPLLSNACDFLLQVSDERGAVPPVLPSFLAFARAPHWRNEPYTATLFPAVGIAASLHELGYRHLWLERATSFCLDALDAQPPRDAHVIRQALRLLDVLDEPERFKRLADAIPGADYLRVDAAADGYGVSPVELSVTADRARRLFGEDVLQAHLDALEDGQQPDGGWPVTWDPGSELARLEWRGHMTLEALRLLREHGRIR